MKSSRRELLEAPTLQMLGRNCRNSPFLPPTAGGSEAAGRSPLLLHLQFPPLQLLVCRWTEQPTALAPGHPLSLWEKPKAQKREKGLKPSSEGGNGSSGWSQKQSPSSSKFFLGLRHREGLSSPKAKPARESSLDDEVKLPIQKAAGLEQDCLRKAQGPLSGTTPGAGATLSPGRLQGIQPGQKAESGKDRAQWLQLYCKAARQEFC